MVDLSWSLTIVHFFLTSDKFFTSFPVFLFNPSFVSVFCYLYFLSVFLLSFLPSYTFSLFFLFLLSSSFAFFPFFLSECHSFIDFLPSFIVSYFLHCLSLPICPSFHRCKKCFYVLYYFFIKNAFFNIFY